MVNAKRCSHMKSEILMFISLNKSAPVYSDDNTALRLKQLQREARRLNTPGRVSCGEGMQSHLATPTHTLHCKKIKGGLGGRGVPWIGSCIHDDWKENTRGPAVALKRHHHSTMHREHEKQEESSARTRIYWSGSAQFISTSISPGTDKLAMCRNYHSQSLSKLRGGVPYQCTAKAKNLRGRNRSVFVP